MNPAIYRLSQTNRASAQIVEPTDDERAAAKAAWTFGRSFAHDSTALGVVAFAGVSLLVFIIVVATFVSGTVRGEYGERDITWFIVIGGSVFVVFAVLAAVSVLVARHHYLHPDKSDVFAADGRLFRTSFMRDKKKYRGDRGTVRINVVESRSALGSTTGRKGRSGFFRTPTRASMTCGGAASGGGTSVSCASPFWRRGSRAVRTRTPSLAWTSSTGDSSSESACG